jgi:Peptidyl-prolyl cis-trans isomerase (rotamase) - cyclophilin family
MYVDRAVKVWCNTCLKVADNECSDHDICNLELGKKRLNERLHCLLERAVIELRQEIRHREPQLGHLQAAHQAWTSSLAAHLEEEMNTQSMALTVAHSELELLENFKKLSIEDDPSNIVSAISSIEGMLTSSQSRPKTAIKQAALMSALQICRIKIHPLLDSHDKNKDKLQNLQIDVGGSNSNEEKALIYLMYHILVEKGGKTGTVNESWQVVDRARKVKNKGRQDDQDGNESQPSNATGAVDHTNLVSIAATSTEFRPAPRNTRIIVNKDLSILNKMLRCFFDIAIDGKVRGKVVFHLRPDVAPKMCANFVALCTGELGYGYKGCKIFKAVADSHIIGGDFEKNNGSGGHSIYNNKDLFIADDCGLRDEEGAVRMKGMGTDERTGGGWVGSQFHIWVKDKEFKSYTRTLVIGKVVEGLELCRYISNLRTFINERGTYIINNDVVIQNCGKL